MASARTCWHGGSSTIAVAAVVAGIIFACSPYLSAHLNGHFDLIGIWTIPLFALAVLPALEGSIAWALAAGAIVGITAYVAYYYAVYQLALLACLIAFAAWDWSIGFGGRPSVQRRLLLVRIRRAPARRPRDRRHRDDRRLRYPDRADSAGDARHVQPAPDILGAGRCRAVDPFSPAHRRARAIVVVVERGRPVLGAMAAAR